MRRIRWAPAAAGDLEEIRNYLCEHHPPMAQSTIGKRYDAACSLTRFPNRGCVGQKEDTRKLIVAPMPYVIVYGVEREVVHFRVIHASRERV